MNNLEYELNFFNFIKLHFIISVIHFEQIKKNDFEKNNITIIVKSEFVIIKNNSQRIIKRVIKTKIRKNIFQYIIK